MKATLEDLYQELWLRNRNEGNLIWETRDKKEIPIKDMTLTHLINTIKMLERNEELREIYLENS